MKTNRERAKALAKNWVIAELEERFIELAKSVLDEAVREAVEAEREACAKVADEHTENYEMWPGTATACRIACYIRARGAR